jgi:hypothetical protein
MTRVLVVVATVVVIAPTVAGAPDASAPGYTLLTVDQAVGFRGADWTGCQNWDWNPTCSGVNFTCGDFFTQQTCTGYTHFSNDVGRCDSNGNRDCIVTPNVVCVTRWMCEWSLENGICRHPWWDLGSKVYALDERCQAIANP